MLPGLSDPRSPHLGNGGSNRRPLLRGVSGWCEFCHAHSALENTAGASRGWENASGWWGQGRHRGGGGAREGGEASDRHSGRGLAGSGRSRLGRKHSPGPHARLRGRRNCHLATIRNYSSPGLLLSTTPNGAGGTTATHRAQIGWDRDTTGGARTEHQPGSLPSKSSFHHWLRAGHQGAADASPSPSCPSPPLPGPSPRPLSNPRDLPPKHGFTKQVLNGKTLGREEMKRRGQDRLG